jgi:putative SOS response-associated peptidase YedK
MCGRYSITVSPDQLAAHWNAELPEAPIISRQNAAPSETLPTLLNDGANRIQMLRWGLIPRWAEDESIGNKLINARAETVAEKPSFRDAFKKRRCLVLADAFYEWQKIDAKRKQPMRIALKSGEPFAFAGLWETWRDPEGQMLRTFTIITTTPNDLSAPIHDRMPVILTREGEARWLDGATSADDLQALLVPYAAELMTADEADNRTLRQIGA